MCTALARQVNQRGYIQMLGCSIKLNNQERPCFNCILDITSASIIVAEGWQWRDNWNLAESKRQVMSFAVDATINYIVALMVRQLGGQVV
jgi:hypothetical protein